MDVNELNMRGDVDCKKPRLLHTSDSSSHNGHISTINLSYQIVLQDHNYGAPLPSHNNDIPYTVQCKSEPTDSHAITGNQIIPNNHRAVLKQTTPKPASISPQSARITRPNGLTTPVAKRQRTTSGTANGAGSVVNHTPASPGVARRPTLSETPKAQSHIVLNTPPLISKAALGFQYGDLNSHLYASIAPEKNPIKEEPKTVPTPNGSSGLSGYLGGWYRGSGATSERIRPRSDMRDSINEDSDDESIGNSPRIGTESDHEGEETETAPECEDEEDEHDDLSLLGASRDTSSHEDSVTRCICKFGHDDGYMICCDRCFVWQHVDCMNLDRNNIPEEYMCELCQPRRVDRARARAIQHRKRQEFRLTTPPPSISLDRGQVCRRERSKDRNRNEEYIDVEKTPKKFQRTYSSSNSGTKHGRGGAKSSTDRSDRLPKPGKRTSQTKWKRRGSERQDEPVPRKRKMFRSKSETIDVGGPSSSGENSPPSNRSNPSGELLLQWIDHYEEAVTNHYSPELRARVAAVKPNGLAGDILSPTSSPVYRLASKAGGYKTLVASNPIRCSAPIIECRGKYMLASQLRPYKSGDGPGLGLANTSGLRPTPHITFHQLIIDNAGPNSNIDMCVDGRSYGNEARFVWQSCQPNAEIKHKVEKGSVHLYLVARTEILESEEITVAHDLKNPLPCPYEGCPHMKTKDICGRTGLAPAQNMSNSQASSTLSPVETDRKRRRRRTNSSMNEASSHQTIAAPPTTVPIENVGTPSTPALSAVLSTPPAQPPTPVKRLHRTPSKILTLAQDGDDSQDGHIHDADDQEANPGSLHEANDNKKKLSREERKMEAIMKAFERMEKAQQRRQESQAKTAHRKDLRDGKDDQGEDIDHSPPPYDRSSSNEKRSTIVQSERTKHFRRGKRGGRTRRASSGTGEDSRTRVRAFSGETNCGNSATEEESEHGGSSSSPGQNTSGVNDEPSMAFKCPKTKKVVFNSWNGEGEVNGNKGDNELLSGPGSLGLSVPSCYMRNPNPRSPTRPFRTAHGLRYGQATSQPNSQQESRSSSNTILNGCRPTTLAALKSQAGSASPDPHGEGMHSNDENAWATPLPGCGGAGSAKKRWLRQAISEETETESPTSGGGLGISSCGNLNEALDHVTPLKKRRLARASLSSETSFTPPSTPTPTTGVSVLGDGVPADSCVSSAMDKEDSIIESLSAENSQSTPPECEDISAEVEIHRNHLDKSTEANDLPTLSLPPNLELAKAMVNLSSSHLFTSSPNREQLGTPGDDEITLNPSENRYASMEEHLIATTVLAQLHQDGNFNSPSRPTWEFRAPDAQFMKCRATNETTDMIATVTSAQNPDEEKPKPIKRKLSILEYRQRKQTMPSENMDTPKDESKSNGLVLSNDANVCRSADSTFSSASKTDPPSPAPSYSSPKSNMMLNECITHSLEGEKGSPTVV